MLTRKKYPSLVKIKQDCGKTPEGIAVKVKCSRMGAEKYSAEGTFAVESVRVFQIICNILQDASRFQHGIKLHIYSVERHLKTFSLKKKMKGSY